MAYDFRPKKSVFYKTKKYLANHTRVLSDLKITKLGIQGVEHPLFCKHEHCKWWQRKLLLSLNKSKENNLEEDDEED